MQSRGSNNRLNGPVFGSRISVLMLSMFATVATVYVAGRLWQDAQNRVYLIKMLDRITGQVMYIYYRNSISSSCSCIYFATFLSCTLCLSQ